MALNKEQKKWVEMQLKAHKHLKYEVNIKLDQKNILERFSVHSNVLRPDKMTALVLAKWLFQNKNLYFNKVVIDMGCGSGIQGVVMGVYGAKKIIFTDLSSAAINNAKKNINRFNLKYKSELLRGDLFEKVKEKVDIIVFNHPFFPDDPKEELLVSKAMLDNGKLIQRFLEDAKRYLNPWGMIIMPYFHLAGIINNPEVQALKHNYKIIEVFRENIKKGLQKGMVSIYEIYPRNFKTVHHRVNSLE